MAWAHIVAVTIDHTKAGASDSTNFVFLFSGTYPALKTIGNGGQIQSSSGFDIAFFSDAGATTLLNFDRDTWSATTGSCNFHVQVGTLSHTVDTVIYIAYGNATVTTDQANPHALWTAVHAEYVCHGGDGTTLNVNDSSVNGATGTNHSCVAAPGVIGGCISNPASDWVDSGTSLPTILDNSNNVISISYWCAPLDANASNFSAQVHDMVSTIANYMMRNSIGNSGGLNLFVMDNLAENNAKYVLASGINFAALAVGFHHFVFVLDVLNHDLSHCGIYVDGSPVTVSVPSGGAYGNVLRPLASNYGLFIYGSAGLTHAKLDEVRAYKTGLNADWVTAEYNNQSSPSTFYSASLPNTGGSSGLLVNPGNDGGMRPQMYGGCNG